VETLDGPLLVLSGAGTGKTRVLTTRFAHILAQGRARPWEVLGVTFTNKAAHQMRERIARLLGHPADELWLGTFHALCVRILRPHVELIGLESNFTILDTDDQLRLLKQILQAADIDTKRWPARSRSVKTGLTSWSTMPARPGAPPSRTIRIRPGTRSLVSTSRRFST
jgi:DNA helicase-2/ATP-dependent DNA helicase PcrA